ncbi:MAG: DedA family protein [Actinomycetota bacterium]|nr:DedA family protein [Actinomycetota bacterium]
MSGLGTGGYLALMVVPLPPEVVLPLAGFYVGQGTLAFLPALGAVTLASLLSALPLYAVGRLGGRPLVARHARLLRLSAARVERAERWFERWGAGVVLFGRMVPGARSVVSLPAGLAAMPLRHYLLLTAAGFAASNSALIGVGWLLGENWPQAAAIASTVSKHALLALPALVAFLASLCWLRRHGTACRQAARPSR